MRVSVTAPRERQPGPRTSVRSTGGFQSDRSGPRGMPKTAKSFVLQFAAPKLTVTTTG